MMIIFKFDDKLEDIDRLDLKKTPLMKSFVKTKSISLVENPSSHHQSQRNTECHH